MAQNAARKPRPVNDPVDPTDHAHNPDADEGTHPAAAPLGTDEEAGRQGKRLPPKKTYVVNSRGDVRAGPGDAGMQDAPRVMDDPQDKPKRGRGPVIAMFVGGLAALIVIWLLTA
ncbi:hypothetical protein ACG74X_11415 [Marivita sp. S0852]|uniref:hypothetical protein n=1 Tax=Marivita sp. S0852 TaxID=3373893 RepID=UPI003981E185